MGGVLGGGPRSDEELKARGHGDAFRFRGREDNEERRGSGGLTGLHRIKFRHPPRGSRAKKRNLGH